MKIYNTLSEKLENLSLDKPVGIYVCGITPYDTTHIGHAFTFIIYDVLVRYLRFLKADVTYVQNVTDIDDDILIMSKKVRVNWQKLGHAEIKKYQQDMRTLNLLVPDIFPKATLHITEMIEITKMLLSKNLAYEKNGNVYFDIHKDKNFGKLSKLDYKAQLEIANERGNFPQDANKRDPLDFVLWQAYKIMEPYWNSPWGKGRPGWHIECSAMSLKYLRPTVTIHGGGEDLIFPHHEAEIAQSENYTQQQFVKIWMHTAMVYCDNKKMSKSLGNMIFVSDLLKKYSPNTIRLFLLSHFYRKAWNYQEQELKKAQRFAQDLERSKRAKALSEKQLRKVAPKFFNAMDKDLNIPSLLKFIVMHSHSKDKAAPSIVKTCSQVLGFKF